MGQHLELVSALLERGADATTLNDNGKNARSFVTSQLLLTLMEQKP
jgi:hypothetical protein